MRRFVAAAFSAAALSATSGTADAATGSPVANPGGDGAWVSAHAASAGSQAARAGHLHRFTLSSVPGASAWGDWYWTKDNVHGSYVVVDYYIKDTRADGKSAGICYDLVSPKVNVHNMCMVSRFGFGKTDHFRWTMQFWNQDKLRVRTAVGKLDTKQHIFYTSALGRWLVLR